MQKLEKFDQRKQRYSSELILPYHYNNINQVARSQSAERSTNTRAAR